MSLSEHEGKYPDRLIQDNIGLIITIRRASLYSFLSQEPGRAREYHHANKFGENDQGRVGFVGLVSPADSLSFEGRCRDGSGMFNIDVVS